MIFNEEMVDGRERVTTDEERVLRGGGGLKRNKFVKIARLSGCKNFVGEREREREVYIRCVR